MAIVIVVLSVLLPRCHTVAMRQLDAELRDKVRVG